MGTTADKLQYLIDAKSSISAAIEAKGGTVPTELTGYGPAIEALPSGGSSDLAKKIVDRTVTEITAADLSGITSIGYAAFQGCSNLSSISIPNNVTSIRDSAFYGCSGLTSISIPDGVTSIRDYAFRNCSGLTSITIPDSVTSIEANTFQNCNALTSITMLGEVTSIGVNAFNGCTSCLIFDFSHATSVPTLRGINAFASTNANKKIIVPDALYDQWKAANNWKSTTNGIVGAITKASEA